MKKTCKYILMLALAALMMTVLTACGAGKADLKDYIKVEYSGYNGSGYANYEVNIERLIEDLKIPDDKQDDAEMVIDEILYMYNKSGLTNGDTVEIEVDTSTLFWLGVSNLEDVGLKLVQTDGDVITYKVSGLEELKEINLFENLSPVVSGYDGYGKIDLSSLLPDLGEDMDLSYSISGTNSKYVSNGDKIKIEVTPTYGSDLNEYLSYFGYHCENNVSDEIEISGLEACKEINWIDYCDYEFKDKSPDSTLVLNSNCLDRLAEETGIDVSNLFVDSDKKYGLSMGDTVALTIKVKGYDAPAVDEYFGENGYIIESDTVDVTVDGVDYLADTIDCFSDELIAEIDEVAQKLIAEDVQKRSKYLSSEATLVKYDWEYLADGASPDWSFSGSVYNRFWFIYKVTVNNSEPYYRGVYLWNVYADKDGNAYATPTKASLDTSSARDLCSKYYIIGDDGSEHAVYGFDSIELFEKDYELGLKSKYNFGSKTLEE